MIRRSQPTIVVLVLLAGFFGGAGVHAERRGTTSRWVCEISMGTPPGWRLRRVHSSQCVAGQSDSEGRVAIGGDANLGIFLCAPGKVSPIGSGQPVDSVRVPLPARPEPPRPDRRRDPPRAGHTFSVVLINGGARYGSLVSGSSISSHVSRARQSPPGRQPSSPMEAARSISTPPSLISTASSTLWTALAPNRHDHGDSVSDGFGSGWHRLRVETCSW